MKPRLPRKLKKRAKTTWITFYGSRYYSEMMSAYRYWQTRGRLPRMDRLRNARRCRGS